MKKNERQNTNYRRRSCEESGAGNEMNEVWLKITDDWTTFPPVNVPVFAAGGNLDAPCILVRCSDYDENGDPAWVWSNPFGQFYFNQETGKWAVWDSEWDDDYQPEYWHPFPDKPKVTE